MKGGKILMTKDMKDIYEKYCNSIYRYLLLLTKDEQLSEELTQETFYQAIKSISKFSGKCSIYTWLCSIAKNCFKNSNVSFLHTNSTSSFQFHKNAMESTAPKSCHYYNLLGSFSQYQMRKKLGE